MLASWALAACLGLIGHADQNDEHLCVHFAVGTTPIVDGSWADMTGNVKARFVGTPMLSHRGPSETLEFTGIERVVLGSASEVGDTILPREQISVSAWVSLAETTKDGGIIGCVQDNGDREQGWVLGYDRERFTFSLASTGADDGDGKLTVLKAKSPIALGRWHYVVGTYDGKVMRIYVDGRLEGESQEQSGSILYPSDGEYTLGGYQDDNELHPLVGSLLEARVYRRSLAPQEIALVAAKNNNLLAWQPAESEELTFLVEPMLQFGTLQSMALVTETTKPTTMEVQYGLTGLLEKRARTDEAKLISEITIKDLQPHTRYFYRVACTDDAGETIRSPIRSFQTAPPADRPWAFGIIGDTQRNPEVTKKCAEGAFACRPNFLLHCGDVVDDGFAKNQWLKDLFGPCANVLGHIPMFPVIGNHEKDSHWYYDYFALPKPEYWYTFHYGNAQFFMIDSNRPLDPGSEQYQWLEKELAASTATWKFTCHHHPCYSSDEDDYGDHVRGRTLLGYSYGDSDAKKLITLYEKYGVDIAFNGHIHLYERTWPILGMSINMKNGVRYITSGGGGGGLETPAPQKTWFSLHVQRTHHYCYAAVFDRTFHFKAYDIEGRLFDTFELVKPEPTSSGAAN